MPVATRLADTGIPDNSCKLITTFYYRGIEGEGEQQMEQIENGADVRVELHSRRELPRPAEERVDSVVASLSALEDESSVDDLERHTWRKRVPVSACDGRLRDRYLAFQGWAEEADVRLDPFFGTRECFTAESGEFEDWLVLPAVCLAVVVDEELVAVYPHRDDSGAATVEDGIDALRERLADRGDGTGARVAVGD